jgi:hypothetical protein
MNHGDPYFLGKSNCSRHAASRLIPDADSIPVAWKFKIFIRVNEKYFQFSLSKLKKLLNIAGKTLGALRFHKPDKL